MPASFQYGGAGWTPVVGDWTGQGKDTIGVVNPSTETWYLRNENSAGAPDFTPFAYGAPGWTPVAGDWNGTGHSGIGVVMPSTGTWYLRNEVSGGGADAGIFQLRRQQLDAYRGRRLGLPGPAAVGRGRRSGWFPPVRRR